MRYYKMRIKPALIWCCKLMRKTKEYKQNTKVTHKKLFKGNHLINHLNYLQWFHNRNIKNQVAHRLHITRSLTLHRTGEILKTLFQSSLKVITDAPLEVLEVSNIHCCNPSGFTHWSSAGNLNKREQRYCGVKCDPVSTSFCYLPICLKSTLCSKNSIL